MTDAEFLQYSKTLFQEALPNGVSGKLWEFIEALNIRIDELVLRLNQQWQPIETMPNDGTLVLLYIPYNRLSLIRLGYRYSKDGPVHPEPPSQHCSVVLYQHATHWMPLEKPNV
jgi:hypothetical protein